MAPLTVTEQQVEASSANDSGAANAAHAGALGQTIETRPMEPVDSRPRPHRNGSPSGEVIIVSFNSYPLKQDVTRRDLVWGACAMVVWVLSFTTGLLLPARDAMSQFWGEDSLSFGHALGYGLIVIVSYAMTNVLFLACSASILGCVAQRWQVSDALRRIPENASLAPSTRAYFAACVRGFFLYLLFLGGFILVSTKETLAAVEYDQYIRVAGLVSIFAFVLGYDPNLLARFIQRVIDVLPNEGDTTKPEPTYTAVTPNGTTAAAGQSLEHPLPENEEEMENKETTYSN